MVTFEAKINNLRAQNFVQHSIDEWSFINYQPIESLTDVHGYTMTVKLVNIQSGTKVDESEVVLRFISDIGFEITVTVI